MNTVANHAGRLIEIRVTGGFQTPAEVDQFFYSVHVVGCRATPETETVGSGRLVTVADWRLCPLLPSEVAEHLKQRIIANNKAVRRAAALAAENSPSAKMQFLRIIRESNFQDRKLFFDPDALATWLSEVLTPTESWRLRRFLSESP